MGQLGFYDLDKRLAAISAKGDPLEALNVIVPFESFRAEIEAVGQAGARGEEEQCRPQALRRRADVQGPGAADALQSGR